MFNDQRFVPLDRSLKHVSCTYANSVRLLLSIDTVSHHMLIALKMENDGNILAHLSENVIKDKPIPNQTGNKAKTRIWTDK